MRLITLSSLEICQKPKKSRLSCLVPNCSKTWLLSGSNQGFMKHSAQSHAFTHWEKYHIQQKHPKAVWKDSMGIEHESIAFCPFCKEASENEFQKRVHGEAGRAV